jgi:uncharacterized RDD family membrane protein YckC
MPESSDLRTAGILRRGIAAVLDYLILSAHFFPITYLVKGTWLMDRSDHLWDGIFDPICLVFLIVIFAYFILFEGFLSTTPGKSMLQMKVLKITGERIGFRESLIRFAGRFVDGIAANLVGVLIMLGNPRRQRLGDKWAGTEVLQRV